MKSRPFSIKEVSDFILERKVCSDRVGKECRIHSADTPTNRLKGRYVRVFR